MSASFSGSTYFLNLNFTGNIYDSYVLGELYEYFDMIITTFQNNTEETGLAIYDQRIIHLSINGSEFEKDHDYIIDTSYYLSFPKIVYNQNYTFVTAIDTSVADYVDVIDFDYTGGIRSISSTEYTFSSIYCAVINPSYDMIEIYSDNEFIRYNYTDKSFTVYQEAAYEYGNFMFAFNDDSYIFLYNNEDGNELYIQRQDSHFNAMNNICPLYSFSQILTRTASAKPLLTDTPGSLGIPLGISSIVVISIGSITAYSNYNHSYLSNCTTFAIVQTHVAFTNPFKFSASSYSQVNLGEFI